MQHVVCVAMQYISMILVASSKENIEPMSEAVNEQVATQNGFDASTERGDKRTLWKSFDHYESLLKKVQQSYACILLLHGHSYQYHS